MRVSRRNGRVSALPHLVGFIVAITSVLTTFAAAQGPYFASGIKIGEVTQDSAIVWVRLTRDRARVGEDAPMPRVRYGHVETGEVIDEPRGRDVMAPIIAFPDGSDITTIEGAAPGASGDVRLRYRASGTDAWSEIDWVAVDPQRDCTVQIPLTGLNPGTEYEIGVQSRASAADGIAEALSGRFRTAPAPTDSARIRFVVTTGQAYRDKDSAEGFHLYRAMLALDPSFFVHTGDIVYYDDLGKTIDLARWHWQRTYSLPTNIQFHRNVAAYFIKDDHDTWMNDCWPGMESPYMGDFTLEQGLAVFLEQVPMGDSTYRTVRWGKDLQIWLVEGRDFRSPNTMPDGPEKTIWGAEQLDWFKRTVQESDATFRILVSPTPIVGPDRTNKRDNHANDAFTYEGNVIREFIASQRNMAVVCGDRHWQYVSVDGPTGVREYSCGPASDAHAGGWSNDRLRPEHRYLNVTGGFLAVTVERVDGVPTLIARHHAVDGTVLNEDRIAAE